MFTRTIRATGEKLTVGTAVEFGADPTDGKWITFCEEHKSIVHSPTQSAAYYTHGIDFCDGCREGSPAPVAKAEPAKKAPAAKAAPAKRAPSKAAGPLQAALDELTARRDRVAAGLPAGFGLERSVAAEKATPAKKAPARKAAR